jgi:hypothetical protein
VAEKMRERKGKGKGKKKKQNMSFSTFFACGETIKKKKK